MKNLELDLECAAMSVKTYVKDYAHYKSKLYKKDNKEEMKQKALKKLEEAMHNMKNIITDYQEGKYE